MNFGPQTAKNKTCILPAIRKFSFFVSLRMRRSPNVSQSSLPGGTTNFCLYCLCHSWRIKTFYQLRKCRKIWGPRQKMKAENIEIFWRAQLTLMVGRSTGQYIQSSMLRGPKQISVGNGVATGGLRCHLTVTGFVYCVCHHCSQPSSHLLYVRWLEFTLIDCFRVFNCVIFISVSVNRWCMSLPIW